MIKYLEQQIERCDELGGMEKEKWAFIQCLKKFKQRQETASAVKTVVMPQEMLDLVRWLAETTMDWHRRRHNALSFEGEECRNYLAMHFPTIQGTMNQINLEKIGEQDYDIKKVGKAVKWLLEEGA